MALKKDSYPMVNFRYEVFIIPEPGDTEKNSKLSFISSAFSAVDKASFSDVSGVWVAFKTELAKDAQGNDIPAITGIEYSTLTLKRGLTGTQSQLMAWVAATMSTDEGGKVAIIPKTIVVNLLNDQGIPLMSWIFNGAFPTKWSMSGLDANNAKVVFEELELKYTGFKAVVLG